MRESLTIADAVVGPGHAVFIIAEISANHRQDLDTAIATIDAAADAGADAVKFQTYSADALTLKSDAPWFRIDEGTAWDGRTLHDIYAEGELPREWHSELFAHAERRGLLAFSSPFDVDAVAFLDGLGAPAFKIASFEIFDHELISAAARTGKPVLISTGVATESDIHSALDVCRSAGNDQVALLKCTSAYPAPSNELNLRTIPDMARRFKCVVGYSDHTLGLSAPLGAVALGASILERHITVDRDAGGLDAGFSTSAQEFAQLVTAIRDLEVGLGRIEYDLTASCARSRRFGRSLFVVADVREGDPVTTDNVRSIRPADGMPPSTLPRLLGRRFAMAVSAGTPLSEELLARD
jgi:pseudaminic acid synthase